MRYFGTLRKKKFEPHLVLRKPSSNAKPFHCDRPSHRKVIRSTRSPRNRTPSDSKRCRCSAYKPGTQRPSAYNTRCHGTVPPSSASTRPTSLGDRLPANSATSPYVITRPGGMASTQVRIRECRSSTESSLDDSCIARECSHSAATRCYRERMSGVETVEVFGQTVDDETRCVHYRSPEDIVAIKFRCCGRYYPCYRCHEEAETHSAQQWHLEERSELALLCGVCNTQHSIDTYLAVERCPTCNSTFNEGCRLHTHLYFETN